MIKKIIALLLVFSALFTFASCVSDEKEEEPTTQIPTVKVTIPEGYTLLRISWLLEEKGLCNSDEFINLVQTYKEWLDLSQYTFLDGIENADNLCVYLEGYIFPLTYDIPEGSTAKDILITMLNGTKKVYTNSLVTRAEASGKSFHEILTIASIIEKECKLEEQRPMVSSVIHNRIAVGMPIQCNPTSNYCDGVIDVLYPDKRDYFEKYYDTYITRELPAGPICNPGINSIEAAINPAQTEYLYFIIGTVEPFEAKYSETFAEHNKYLKENYELIYGK